MTLAVTFFITGSDLESLRAVFNEKEKELSVAVAKVDELTRQLDDLRQGGKETTTAQTAAALELEKLRRELMVSFLRGIFCSGYDYYATAQGHIVRRLIFLFIFTKPLNYCSANVMTREMLCSAA